MRQHKILSHTLLILSIINFTLAAPTAVRERPEVRLDAKVTRDVKAASQKRRELLDESGSLNVPRPDHAAPPIPDPIDRWHQQSPRSPTGSRLPVGSIPVADSPTLSPPPPAPESGSTNVPSLDYEPPSSPDSMDSILRQIDFSPPYSPDSLGSIKGWQYVWPSPGSPTESRLPVGSMPVAGSPSLSPPPPAPESGSSDVPGLDHASPPSPDSTDSIWWQTGRTPPYSPDSPGSLKGWNYVPPSPGSMPVASSLSPPPPESGSTSVPWLDHTPPSSPDSTDSIWWQTDRTPPGSPDNLGSLKGWNYVPPSPGSPTGSRLPVGSTPVVSSLSPPAPHSPHSSQLGPSEDRFPSSPGFSVSSDTLSSTGSTSNQPTPPQGPGVGSDRHSLLNPEPVPEFEFWDKVLKGRIKRRTSGSDAVNLAQKDPSSRYSNLDDLPQFNG